MTEDTSAVAPKPPVEVLSMITSEPTEKVDADEYTSAPETLPLLISSITAIASSPFLSISAVLSLELDLGTSLCDNACL